MILVDTLGNSALLFLMLQSAWKGHAANDTTRSKVVNTRPLKQLVRFEHCNA